MSIKEKRTFEEEKKNGMNVVTNMNGEKRADNKLEAKLFPAGLPKDLSYEDAVKTFEMSLDRRPKSVDELLEFFRNRKLNKAKASKSRQKAINTLASKKGISKKKAKQRLSVAIALKKAGKSDKRRTT